MRIAISFLLPILLARPCAAQPPVEEAVAAYRALAQRMGPERLEAYAPVLECLYGETNVRRERLRERGLGQSHPAELHVLSARPNEVVLLDRGWYLFEEWRGGAHEKIVRLRRVEGAWRVVAETGIRSRGCMQELFARVPPPSARFARCRRATARAFRQVQARCGQEMEQHGCTYNSFAVAQAAAECFEGQTVDLTSMSRVRSVRDIAWPAQSYRVVGDMGERASATFLALTIGDVDGDRREDAVVLLRSDDETIAVAYSVRGGEVVEIGIVWRAERDLANPTIAISDRAVVIAGTGESVRIRHQRGGFVRIGD